MTNHTLSRRSVLRGAGGLALSLPLLQLMLPRRASAATPPKRFFVWSTPNGTVADRWICPVGASESDFTLSDILAPLERHKADMVGLQNLQQRGGHAHALASSLTGRGFTDRGYPKIYAQGISVDQHIAKKWEGLTPVPSLQVGTIVKQNRDTVSAASWAEAGRALTSENNPFALYARLFATNTTDMQTTAKRSFSARRSTLDSVLSQATTLAKRSGQSDRKVIENYLESLRAVEKQMAALDAKAGQCKPPAIGADPTKPGAATWWMQNENVPQIMKIQADLMAAILACDLTRVIAYNVSNDGGAGRVHSWVPENPTGVDWHGVSHMVEKGQDAPMVAVERWNNAQLAYFLDRLKSYDEGGRNLLWSTLVFANDEYGPNGPAKYLDGGKANYSHYARMMPYALYGQAGGRLKTGRWLTYPLKPDGTGTPHTQLLVSILNALDIPDQAFGDPNAMQGPLPRLL